MKKLLGLIGGGALLLVSLVVGGAMLFSGNGDGNGGSGSDDDKDTGIVTDDIFEKEDEEEKTSITIKIEENSIWIDDKECEDCEELREQISRLQSKGNVKVFEVEHDYAIKSTYDEVKDMLLDLEDTLGISVDYND